MFRSATKARCQGQLLLFVTQLPQSLQQADDGDRVVEWGVSGRIAGGQGCNLLFRACLAQSL